MKEHPSKYKGIYGTVIKRILDIVLSLGAVILLSPVLLILAVLVRLNLGKPILFRQMRPGRDEQIFLMYKFRSMTDRKRDDGELLPDELRLTKFGKLLRSTSLDELPELFNILKGDMSIVGPRPLAVSYLPYYDDIERQRHNVRPGLTGLAQINGRNAASWEERFRHDVYYVNHLSFGLDLRILLKTIGKVLKRSDIGVAGVSRPENFNEYRKRQLDARQDRS